MTTRALAAIVCIAVGTPTHTQAQTSTQTPTSTHSSALTAAAAPRGGQSPQSGRAMPVALTFAWPVGMAATIEVQLSKTVAIDGKQRETTGGIRYRMRVEAHPEGRLISYDGFELMGTPVPAAAAPAIEEYLMSLMPSIVVAPDGRFLRVADLAKIRAAMAAFLETVKEKAPDGNIPASAQQILNGLMSEEVLTQLAAAEWQHFIGAFVGYTGKIGQADEFDSEEPSPILPGLQLPMRTRFVAAQLVPCEPGRAPDSCVVMQVRSAVAPGGMQTIAKRMFEGVKDMQRVTFEHIDVTSEVLATLEPSSMKPYRVVFMRSIAFTGTKPGEGRGSLSQSQTRAYRIRYKD